MLHLRFAFGAAACVVVLVCSDMLPDLKDVCPMYIHQRVQNNTSQYSKVYNNIVKVYSLHSSLTISGVIEIG